MLPLLFAGIGFALWAILIIQTYYSTYYSSIDHISVDYIQNLIGSGKLTDSPFFEYAMTMIVIYGIYKTLTLIFNGKNTISFGVFSLVGYTLLHLLVVCVIYASMPEGKQMLIPLGGSSGIILFLHVLSLLIYPVLVTLIARASGYSILSRVIPRWDERDTRIAVLVETTFGFFIFSTGLLIL